MHGAHRLGVGAAGFLRLAAVRLLGAPARKAAAFFVCRPLRTLACLSPDCRPSSAASSAATATTRIAAAIRPLLLPHL